MYPVSSVRNKNFGGGFDPQSVSGLQLYYLATSSSDAGSVPDLSGNGHTGVAAATKPTVTTNGGQYVFHFDGSASKPIVNADTITCTHLFVVAAYTDATFTGTPSFPGLVGGHTTNMLVGADSTQSFFDFSNITEYRLNGVVDPTFVAPRGGTLGLISAKYASVSIDGIQIGQDRGHTTRIWKGDVGLVAVYNNSGMTAGEYTYLRKGFAGLKNIVSN